MKISGLQCFKNWSRKHEQDISKEDRQRMCTIQKGLNHHSWINNTEKLIPPGTMGSTSVFCTLGALPSVEQVSVFSMYINPTAGQLMLDTQASTLFNVT
jgi:hypothetical protein